jgi:hypothetical protein
LTYFTFAFPVLKIALHHAKFESEVEMLAAGRTEFLEWGVQLRRGRAA